MADSDLLSEVIAAGSFLIAQSPSRAAAPWPALVTKVPALLLGTSLPKLAASIEKNVGPASIDQAAPYLGWAAQSLGALSAPDALEQAASQLLAVPATFALDLSPAMAGNLRVTVLPDRVRDEWPDAADHFSVTATFSGNPSRQATGAMPTASTEPLVLSFPDVPLRGRVAIGVSIYARNNWVCGSGQSVVTAFQETGSATVDVSLSISENRATLSSDTEYSHKRKLVYDTTAQQHVWQAGPAPKAVQSGSSDCPGSGNVLCRLAGITLNEGALMLGYAWQASGQGLSPCSQPSADGGQLYAFQNISVPSPQAALKFPTCGFTLPAPLVYQRSGPNDDADPGNAYNFYLSPRAASAGPAYHLRGVTLDAQTTFDLSQTLSWGALLEDDLTAFAVHPKGYVIAVSYGRSKLEILPLSSAPVAEADAPLALLTSGPGTLPGLLKGPIALCLTGDLVVLVLEQDNARIQAFDVYGNPVPYFPQGSPFAALQPETPVPAYLDMSVTGDGWIYVLSYVNMGNTATDYRLDIYTPSGGFLSRTVGVNGAKIVVDSWRRVYTLNYESFLGPGGRTEPSVSQWVPS